MSGAQASAVFLDRDGTLTRESDWVTKPEDLELLPGAARAVGRLNAARLPVVLVTNQSAVARGMIDEAALERIHAHLRALLARAGARVDALYYCPHHLTEGRGPYATECECRKPRAGLLVRAARELELELATSWIVGDAERDLLAGESLGVRAILVATGKGTSEQARLARAGRAPRAFVADLDAAVDAILAERQGK
ncbi:MAG: D-glycero-alpha-D-manno-heptose-1,7-bisphosphate 7-phosphatase [Planctomycetota bacterium]